MVRDVDVPKKYINFMKNFMKKKELVQESFVKYFMWQILNITVNSLLKMFFFYQVECDITFHVI